LVNTDSSDDRSRLRNGVQQLADPGAVGRGKRLEGKRHRTAAALVQLRAERQPKEAGAAGLQQLPCPPHGRMFEFAAADRSDRAGFRHEHLRPDLSRS
jgi:hypothetical protein